MTKSIIAFSFLIFSQASAALNEEADDDKDSKNIIHAISIKELKDKIIAYLPNALRLVSKKFDQIMRERQTTIELPDAMTNKEFMQCIKRYPNLRTISTRRTENLTPDIFEKGLDSSHMLKSIHCGQVWVNDTFIEKFNTKIIHVAMRNNLDITPKLLQNLSNVQSLTIMQGFKDTVIKDIIDFMQNSKTLTALSICANNISGKNATILGEALKSNDTLTTLNLIGCQMKERSLSEITQGLAENKTLTSLSLSQCDLDDKDILSMGKKLQSNSSIKAINLWGNKIDPPARKIFKRLLKDKQIQISF